MDTLKTVCVAKFPGWHVFTAFPQPLEPVFPNFKPAVVDQPAPPCHEYAHAFQFSLPCDFFRTLLPFAQLVKQADKDIRPSRENSVSRRNAVDAVAVSRVARVELFNETGNLF